MRKILLPMVLFVIGTCFVNATESKVLFSETFASSQGDFTILDIKIPDALSYIWKHDPKYGMCAGAYVNNHSYESESWLISPKFSLDRCASAYAAYEHAAKFQNGAVDRGVTVWAAIDPRVDTIIVEEWTQLVVPTYPTKGTWNFYPTGQISLQEFIGLDNVRIAIRYNSTNQAADTYELKNLSVTGIIGETYTITAVANDPTRGTVRGGGIFAEGASVTLTATPNEGYNFSFWEDGSTSATRDVVVSSDATYTAYFSTAEEISVSQALYYARNLTAGAVTSNYYYISGVVSAAKVDTLHMDADFTLTDNTGSITVYGSKGLDAIAFRFFGQIQNGDSVTVYARIQNYITSRTEVEDEDIYGNPYTRIEYTTTPELVKGRLTYQNNHYVFQDGIVYQISSNNVITATNPFSIGEAAIIRDSLLIDDVLLPVTKVKNDAFQNQNITKLFFPESITEIGAGAFYNCAKFKTVISRAINPPAASDGTFTGFSNFDCTLYVPEESVEAYRNADGWKAFSFVKPLTSCTLNLSCNADEGTVSGAGQYLMGDKINLCATPNIGYRFTNWSDEHTDNPYPYIIIEDVSLTAVFELRHAEKVQVDEEVVVVPTNNSADITWPSISGAVTYELLIKDKDGKIICTLIFNENGILTQIAFAPSRDRTSKQTQVAGFSFTVTGLEGGTEYDLTITAKDSNGNTLDTQQTSFVTPAKTATCIDQVTSDQSSVTNKILRNGQLFIIRDGKMYNAQGVEVR